MNVESGFEVENSALVAEVEPVCAVKTASIDHIITMSHHLICVYDSRECAHACVHNMCVC
jgi:hypothetical protein